VGVVNIDLNNLDSLLFEIAEWSSYASYAESYKRDYNFTCGYPMKRHCDKEECMSGDSSLASKWFK
jgi:hypothetical protein